MLEWTADNNLESLASLVPQLALELAVEPGHIYTRVDGSMLSADISGFTALSERLADKGKAGAEEITSLISRCFSALIDAAYEYGGEVIKFGGDALLVLFRGDAHEIRVAAAGMAMQKALRESAAAQQANLTMTVGAAEGPFDTCLVGTSTRDLLMTGPAASHVIELEGNAEKGDTLISSGIADALGDLAVTSEHELGFVLENDIAGPTVGPAGRQLSADVLKSLIPPGVQTHFAAFESLGGEHRIVTVAFLAVAGVESLLVEDGGQATADALGELVDSVHEICDRYEVTPLHTDIAPDGLKYVLCAGAPITRGDTADAMLEATLEMAVIDSPFSLKFGVQQGRVFAGFLGSPNRRTYTIMGDTVNTAARMLGKADDRDIVAVDDVIEATRTVFVTESIEPFHVKGKTEPISANRVVGSTDSVRSRSTGTPIIGREEELQAIVAMLEAGGHVIELIGPAGAGKSTLLEAVRTEATERSMHIATAGCSPYTQRTPYALLRSLLRKVLDIDTFADAEVAGKILLDVVHEKAPKLAPWLPVLAIPVGATVPDTPEASAIDPKFLRSQINIHVSALLRATLPASTLIVLEDTHWIDESSADYFDAVSRVIAGSEVDESWCVILTLRPEGEWHPDTGERPLDSIIVEALTPDDVRNLAMASSTIDLTDQQLDAIVEQADGNPLFAVELARGMAASTGDAIPDSVEQLISARIDALEPGLRHCLRVAAVFGYRLRKSGLREVLQPTPLPSLDALDEFVSSNTRGDLSFTHALYRDVAYEGLPFAQRRRLHRSIGEYLEGQASNPESLAGLLALHFAEAKDSARAWRYGVLAGDTAIKQAATLEAVANYRRALDLVSRVRSVDKTEVARVALALGDAASLVGELGQAERAFRKARSLATDAEGELTAMLRIGRLREKDGRYGEAGKWYERVGARVAEAERGEFLRVRSQMHYYRSGLFHRRNDQQSCIVEARLALGAAEDADDVRGMAEALQRLHLATIYLKRPDRIEYGPKALQLFRELGDYERQASVLNNLGIEHYFNGRWVEAAQSYRMATEVGLKAGSMIDGMLGALNSGEILSDQGHWDEAIELLESARRNWDYGRFPIGAATAKHFLGVAHDRRGDDDEAKAYLTEALESMTELGLKDEALDIRSRIVVADVFNGTAGLDAADSFLAELGADHPLRSRLLRARAVSLAADDRWDTAQAELVENAESLSGYDRALTLRLLAHFGDGTDPSWGTEAQEIFDGLGVVRLRPLPTL